MEKIILTLNDKNNLIKEYKKLNLIKLNIIEEIKKTKLLGDLSENSEYKSAKQKKALVEKKLLEIKYKIFNSIVINKEDIKNKNKISFSAEIILKNIENNKTLKYKIVSDEEINIKFGYISINSPIAKLLLGKTKNEIIKIKKLNKITKFKIISIKY